MRRLIWIAALVISSLPVFAQGYPDVEAVREALLAKDVPSVMKHLPVAVQKAMNELTPAERNEFGQMFLVGRSLEREGAKFSSGTTGDVLVVVEEPGSTGQKIEIVLQKRISDGYESVLRFGPRGAELAADFNGTLDVWLRYEEGEWRIWELSPSREKVELSDEKFLSKIRHSKQDANESSAVGTMRTYNTAMVTYASTYPEIGYPSTLEELGGPDKGAEPSPHRCGLVDSLLSTPPFRKNGYQFTYRPKGRDGYTLVGVPVGTRREGQRSFFTDESGVIRYTEDDREPNASDPPLQ